MEAGRWIVVDCMTFYPNVQTFDDEDAATNAYDALTPDQMMGKDEPIILAKIVRKKPADRGGETNEAAVNHQPENDDQQDREDRELGALLASIALIEDASIAKRLSSLYGRLTGESQDETADRFAMQRRAMATISNGLGPGTKNE